MQKIHGECFRLWLYGIPECIKEKLLPGLQRTYFHHKLPACSLRQSTSLITNKNSKWGNFMGAMLISMLLLASDVEMQDTNPRDD